MKPLYKTYEPEKPWYDKWFWLMLSFFFFPLFLYAVTKTSLFGIRTKFFIWTAPILAMLLASLFVDTPPPPPPPTAAEIRQQAVNDSIQKENEAVYKMIKDIRYFARNEIKKTLKDPDSFEEISHFEYEISNPKPDAVYQAKVTYRAKNSFGGYVVETKCVLFSKAGHITDFYDCE